ncbi:2-oxoisovalerate dehydrogenase E1 component, alpha subunit [Puccinia sorghi]|uniref:2-oxoisovalerate dehydrogenase subunit alpha n=1 Tax=Puccinia sorghi TaxID=27349 RepID=A0A0L6UDY4_9BASI|nr:2-oxoisovalerate dehydrogenase E1 component, alpha subunit [Puccinia sorghi]
MAALRIIQQAAQRERSPRLSLRRSAGSICSPSPSIRSYTANPLKPLPSFHPLIPLKILSPDTHKNGSLQSLPLPHLADLESQSFAVKLYEIMLGLPILDTFMSNLQRHGRISFYMTSYGEEGAVVGSAAALGKHDEVYAQYRGMCFKQGILLWRGCSLDYLMAQCFGSVEDKSSKGRQMPVHYASKEHHFHSISSPLATQIPQAAGAAYTLKRMRQKGERVDDCVVCYLGEGAASEGDFHAGVNMASVLGGPIVFFIRYSPRNFRTTGLPSLLRPPNNSRETELLPGLLVRYGIDAIRVDGNDPLAVYLATREARRRALEGAGRAVMVEAMTYRVGHHSTSDDSSAYRNPNDVDQWRKRDNPINRMRGFLESRAWWDATKEEERIKKWKSDISQSVKRTEKVFFFLSMSKPSLKDMWTDTYGTEQAHLDEQRKESNRIMQKYSEYRVYKEELKKFSHP